MKGLVRRFLQVSLLGALIIAGCAKEGSKYLGRWVNTKNPNDTIKIARNGDQYLIITSSDKKIGAAYKDGALQVPGMLGGITLTYLQNSDTIVAPGFFGQAEYKRSK